MAGPLGGFGVGVNRTNSDQFAQPCFGNLAIVEFEKREDGQDDGARDQPAGRRRWRD